MLLPDLPSSTADAAAIEADRAASRPFQILLLRHEEQASGSFRPAASVALTPALRTSGLLLDLPAEELRSLLLLLTFVHPNGHIQPSVLELGEALHLSQMQTRARMRRLERFVWQGKPLLYELRRDSGLHAYAPSPRILHIEHEAKSAAHDGNAAPVLRAAGREAVIAHSRATYARPRDEVEAEIARANGWPWPFKSLAQVQAEMRQKAQQMQDAMQRDSAPAPPGQPPKPPDPPSDRSASIALPTSSLMPSPMNPASNTDPVSHPLLPDPLAGLRNELLTIGVPSEHAERLLANHDAAQIRQQIEWLPLRNANSPSRFLVAAIEKDYEAPAILRQRNALEQGLEAAASEKQPADEEAADRGVQPDPAPSTPHNVETSVTDTPRSLPLP